MTEVGVTARSGDPRDTGADARVVPFFEGETLAEAALQALADSGEAKAAPKKVALTHVDGQRVLVAGMGKREDLDPETARLAGAAAAKRAAAAGAKSLSWDAPAGAAAGIVEGTLLALYRFDRFKSSPDEDDEGNGIGSLEVVGGDPEEVERARVVATAQNGARDLQNLPANVATPSFLANRAQEIAAAHSTIETEAHGRDWIEAQGMGAFASVAQGTPEEPRMIVMRYSNGGSHLGFVGKAVTFDTGGISIKPAGRMHEMKFDMSGGAAVLESVAAIAELGVPVTITAVVPATENMPSGRSVKPGDIVAAMNGKTIEVNNTDAEGRLILADALCYAREQGVERIVDLATLTGAIITALGNTYVGLFSNDDDWFREVDAAGSTTGEIGWRLPLHPEYADIIKGKYADLDNAPEVRKASSITAAEFLRKFVDEVPWVHMDIAGTAWGMGRAYTGKGASGFGVRTLIELARRVGGSA